MDINSSGHYSNSLLTINTKGLVFRLFTPFKVKNLEDGKVYWVNRIYWDVEGNPCYEVNGNMMPYYLFSILNF